MALEENSTNMPYDLNECTYHDVDSLSSYIGGDFKNFTLIHINIRSNSRNFDEFVIFLNQANLNFSVIILTEIWMACESQWQEVLGYKAYHSFRENKAGGGVMILVNDYCKSTVNQQLSVTCPNAEVLAVDVDTGGEKFVIFGIYRPPRGSILNFRDALCGRLQLVNCNKTIFSKRF